MKAFSYWTSAVYTACIFSVITPSSPAVTQLHTSRGNAEREDDGAYSPRDKQHNVDGVHHSDFDHEAILGSHKEAEEFDTLSPEESKQRLSILLTKMDLNKDGVISKQELKSWILRSFRMLSEEESAERFEDTDLDKNEKVEWTEYLADTFGVDMNDLTEEDNKLIVTDRIMFDVADQNKDGVLDKKEFVLFTHPEEHPEMHPLIVNQTLDEKDTNGDGFIDLQEYIGEKGLSHDKAWLIDEKAKFDGDYDKDGDGHLNRAEILEWMVPSNDEIADEEVEHLFTECDLDSDGFISFEEAIQNHDVFVGSEATDYGDHLHKIHAFPDEL